MKGKSNRIKRLFAGISTGLVACMVLSILPTNVFAATKDPISNTDYSIVSSKDYAIAPGVTETDVIWNDNTGDSQVVGFMSTIDADALADGSVKVVASYGGFYEGSDSSKWSVTSWGLASTTGQAAAYEKATGENVVFATNGDYYNMQTGQPSGVLIMNGVNCNPDKTAAEPYFAILNDGTAVIRKAGTSVEDVQEAISGPFFLIQDGKIVTSPNNTDQMPRNSIGLTADGDIITFVADGRQYPYSVGTTLYELACYLLDQGCVDALYLDGGGSATFASELEGSGQLTVRNSPSDGSERTVSSALLVISTVTPSGEFDHASISPNGEEYMPYSTVQFCAVGVDYSGGEATLPDGVIWALAEDSAAMGTIDPSTGEFISNGTVGAVNVELYYGDKVVGTTTVYISEPDEIYFSSSSVSLDFGEQSDLGLVIRANNVALNTCAEGLTWYVSDDSIGTVENNLFVAATGDSTLSGTVTVSYTRQDGEVLTASVNVEIGKMPVVLLDFEADADGNVAQCAHYHWGKSPNYYGDDETLLASTVTVNTSGTYTGSAVTSTISAPFRFTGNWDSSVPAADIFRANGYTYYLWPNGTISTPTDGQVGSLAVLSEGDGGEVRFGDYSLELNYDYASYDGSANANFYVRYCGDPIYIDGTPSELGVWVYADSQSYGYTLYGQIAVWNGSDYTTKYYVLRHDSDGDGDIDNDDNGYIDWEGWMYVCADISDCAAYYSEEHPYLIEPGNGFLWLCYQPAAGRSGRYAGTIYFDNFRVSYGTDLDDLTNPVISSVTANAVELLNANEIPTIDTNTVEITAYYEDPESANRSGIDASAVTIEIDGAVISSDNSDSQATIRLDLNNGLHSIKVTTYDVFGNYSSETCYLNVDSAEADTVSAALTGADTVTMGADYVLTLASIGAVQTVEMTVVQVNSDFGEPAVAFSDNWDGEVIYTSTGFKKAMMTITAAYTGEEIPSDAVIATLSFDVPNTLDQETDFFTYQVSNITCADANGNVTTSAQAKVKLSLSAYYTLQAGTSVSGLDTTLTVTTEDGSPAEGVTIYVNGAEAGTTDENGELLTNASVNLSGGNTFTAYAVDASGRSSFTTTVTVMNAVSDAAPTALALNASVDPDTTQCITWMAGLNANKEAAVRYSASLNEDGTLANPITVTGTATLHAFTTDKTAAYLNLVTLTGLTPAATYYYQVGDNSDTEEHWSAVSYFTTDGGENGTTNFFVLGDTQMTGNESTDATEIGYLTTIASAVTGMDFGLQTGDYIDNGGNYTMWAEMQNVFGSEFTGIDMIHTLGNHEYYGDSTGSAAGILLSLGTSDYYSVEYGDVYIAVIHNSASMREALEWLVSDAQASSATWKVLSVHEPVFYTNASSASQYYLTVPDAVAEAGIDVVFSGHDHSYARNVDAESGAVYFICGDLGEKSRNVNYAATDNGFDFDFISQDYSALYLTVSAQAAEHGNDCAMTITAKDYDGTIIDSYTITKLGTCTDGHTWESYDRDTGNLICSACGTEAPAVDEYYTGFISDHATGNMLYLVGGIPRTGHQYISGSHYYFDADGFAYDGEYVLCGETCLFAGGQYVSCSTADVLLAGLAGTNVNFVFYSDGRMVLDGSGATDSYSTSGYSPWYAYRYSIKSIAIGAGITKIGTYAFSGAINCVSVSFAEGSSLTTINGSAFYYMSSLTEITLPENVASIGNYAFGYGKRLTSVYLPDGVSSINATAFNYCSSGLVLSVGYDSYAKDWAQTNGFSYVERPLPEPPLASGTCGEHITWTLSTDGVLTLTGSGAMTSYSGKKTSVPWYNYRAAITSIIIDPAITELSAYSFYGATNCTSVSFGENSQLTKIGGSAFYYMSSLTEITLPEKVISIGNYAFGYGKRLTSVYLPDGVSSINATAFNYCSSGLVLSVGYDSYAKDWAQTNGFRYVEREQTDAPLASGTCGEHITWTLSTDGVLTLTGSGTMTSYSGKKTSVPWYNYRAAIKSIIIDPAITELSAYAFYGATNCTSVSFGENSQLTKIGGSAFYYMSSLTEITLPENVASIGNYAFGYGKRLTSVYLPDGVSSINATAFNYCNSGLVLSVGSDSYAKDWAQTNGVAYTVRSSGEN